jgi:hypothetical protein
MTGNDSHDILDLTDIQDEEPTYVCDHCEIPMLPYLDIEGTRHTRGELWQCGSCGIIKDTEMDQLKHGESLSSKASAGGPMFESIEIDQSPKSTSRGRGEEFDFDRLEDEQIESEGGTILHKRVTSADGRVLLDKRNDQY